MYCASGILHAYESYRSLVRGAGLSSNALPRGAVVLDQQEIGTYEAAYDPREELAVDNEYEAAMPFRDPGHISRSEIRLAHALARSGTTKRDQSWDFIKPLWGKYIKAMRDVRFSYAASRPTFCVHAFTYCITSAPTALSGLSTH